MRVEISRDELWPWWTMEPESPQDDGVGEGVEVPEELWLRYESVTADFFRVQQEVRELFRSKYPNQQED